MAAAAQRRQERGKSHVTEVGMEASQTAVGRGAFFRERVRRPKMSEKKKST